MTPTVYAVSSWTGDTWKGTPWEGNSWDGSDLKWEGTPWEGNKWEGAEIEHSSINIDEDINPDWSNIPWYLESWYIDRWSDDGFYGENWSLPSFYGDEIAGYSDLQNGYNGRPSLGNPWSYSGFIGRQITPGIATDIGSSTDFNQNMANAMSYLTVDVMGGYASFISDGLKHQRYLDAGRTDSGLGKKATSAFGNMLVNGIKLSGLDETYVDPFETGITAYDGVQGYNTIKNAANVRSYSKDLRQFTQTKREYRDVSKMAKKSGSPLTKVPALEKALSKFNIVTAGIGAAYSGYQTYNMWNDMSDVLDSDASGASKTLAVAEVTEGTGSTLMSAGAVVAAVPLPGARVAAGVMIIGGAILFGASKAAKFYARNWDKIKVGSKYLWSGAKHKAKKGLKAVINLFNG